MLQYQASLLTVPHTSGHTGTRHRHNEVTGFDSLNHEAHKSRANQAAFFVPVRMSKDNGRAVRGAERLAGPHASLSTCTVPSSLVTGGERSYRPLHEDSDMANHATSTGKIRPNSTKLLKADGTESRVHWIREQTVIKRIRRTLAKRDHSLQIHSEGTQARDEHGQYVVLDEHKAVLSANCKLPELARFLEVLADDEMIEPPAGKGWVYHVAREHVEIVDGKRVRLRDRLTKDYRTERAARKAAFGIKDRAGLVVVGMDADDALALRFEEAQRAHQAEALTEIHVAIDANPTLRYLRSEAGCPITWGRAVEIDRQLQGDRKWAGKPVAERFDEVVSRLADLGLAAVESEVSAHD